MSIPVESGALARLVAVLPDARLGAEAPAGGAGESWAGASSAALRAASRGRAGATHLWSRAWPTSAVCRWATRWPPTSRSPSARTAWPGGERAGLREMAAAYRAASRTCWRRTRSAWATEGRLLVPRRVAAGGRPVPALRERRGPGARRGADGAEVSALRDRRARRPRGQPLLRAHPLRRFRPDHGPRLGGGLLCRARGRPGPLVRGALDRSPRRLAGSAPEVPGGRRRARAHARRPAAPAPRGARRSASSPKPRCRARRSPWRSPASASTSSIPTSPYPTPGPACSRPASSAPPTETGTSCPT